MNPTRKLKVLQDSKGREFVVEVSDVDLTSFVDAAVDSKGNTEFEAVSVKDKIERIRNTLGDLISNTTSDILGSFDEQKTFIPTKITLEFGVELSGEGEIWFIAKGNASGSIKICVEWEKNKKNG